MRRSGAVGRARGRAWTLADLDRSEEYRLFFDAGTHRWELVGSTGERVVTRSRVGGLDGVGPGAERTPAEAGAPGGPEAGVPASAGSTAPGRHRKDDASL